MTNFREFYAYSLKYHQKLLSPNSQMGTISNLIPAVKEKNRIMDVKWEYSGVSQSLGVRE